MGRQKLGNRNAQINNQQKRGMKDSKGLVEFTTGEELKHNRPHDRNR